MPNAIKYNTSAETLALKKGNFWIGTGDVGKGPTSSTGYYNGITPPSGGYTIYLNKASDGPSIYTITTEAQLTGLTNTLSVSTNLIKNNNGGNFADGTISPFNYPYPAQTFPTVFDVSNDKPYVGSSTTYALKFPGGVGGAIYSDPSPFTMTVGVVYTFSFWYKQNNSTQSSFNFNNQGGSGDINGNFIASITTGPSQTWQRFSWTFTNVTNKVYFIISPMTAGSEVLMTEFTLTEGSMPGGPGLTTAGNCLNWFTTQTDKMIFNIDYPAIVTNGLVLNLDAGFSPSFATIPSNANLSTVTPWYDVSSGGNNGTLTNGPTYSTNGGGSIVFDGVDDYVNIPDNSVLDFTGSVNLTSEVWIKFNLYKDISFVNAKGDGSGLTNNYNYFFIGTDIAFYFRFSNGTTSQASPIIGSSTLPTGSWGHVVGVLDTSAIRIYLNGTEIGTATARTINPAANNSPFYISTPSYSLNGSVGASRIYNRALTAAEVLQNYQATLPGVLGENIVTSGLILYLDAGYPTSYPTSGLTWYDVSGYGNNGTLTNGAIFNSADGGSIVFDGVDDEVVLPINSIFNTPSVTFEVWANLQEINDRHILYVNWTGNALEVNSDRSVVMFNYSNAAGQVGSKTTSGAINWNVWTHFVGTYDDSSQTLRTYINGVLLATRTSTPSTVYSIYVHKISGTDFGGEVKGKISITRHYNRALSASEILQNYNATKSRFGL